MPKAITLSGVIAAATLPLPSGAMAADGRMGASSTGSIVISVSVAPRAWRQTADQLCIAAPVSGYSLRLDGSTQTVSPDGTGTGVCALGATAAALPASVARSGDTLLIVAE